MDERNDLQKLPQGWVWTTVADVLKTLESGSRPKGGVSGIVEGVPSLGGEHLKYDGRFDFSQIRFIPEEFYRKMSRGKIATNDVLVVKDGATTGKTSFVSDSFPYKEAAVNEHVFILRVFENDTNPRFVFYWMQSPYGQNCVDENFRGAAQGGITASFVVNSRFPLAPLPEQHRIVAKIEEVFSDLDAGVAALEQAQAELKRYRQAVLKAAVEGKLTAEWRAAHRDEIEPASVLLERIRAEREKDSHAKAQRRKEVAELDTRGLGELPEGWEWVNWETILANENGAFRRGPFGSTLTKSIFVEKGYKVYEQYCAINDDCSFGRYYITPEKFKQMRAFEVKAGDYLMSCSGVTLGRITRVPEKYAEGIINQALLRIRLDEQIVEHKYFLHLFRSPIFQKSLFDNSTGTAIPNVKGVKELKAIVIALPPLAEQEQIVAEVERRLSVADEIAKTVETALAQAERLRQSILKRAFAGRLVAQDAADEPAEKLLERIRETRERRVETDGKQKEKAKGTKRGKNKKQQARLME